MQINVKISKLCFSDYRFMDVVTIEKTIEADSVLDAFEILNQRFVVEYDITMGNSRTVAIHAEEVRS